MFSTPNNYYQSRSITNSPHCREFLLYQTPRIISFTYKGIDSRKVSQSEYVNRSKVMTDSRNKEERNQKKIKLTSKLGSSLKSTKKVPTNKPTKINLISSRRSNRSDYNLSRSSKLSVHSQPAQMVHLPNHITVGNFVQSFSCDIFSACNEGSGVDLGEKINIPFEEKKLSQIREVQLSELDNEEDKIQRKVLNNSENLKVNSSFQSQTIGNFKKKKIFDMSLNLNTTNDLSPGREIRRKSIFKPREKSPFASKDHSLELRKRIFTQIVDSLERSPNFGVKNEQQLLDETQIPKNILQSWEQFSESSHSWGDQSFSVPLGVVQEVKLEESGVKEVY